MTDILDTDIAVIGAGTAGLTAFHEVRRAGRSALLIDHGPLGTTCARTGCMPSKAVCRFTFNVSLLHFQLALNGLPQTLLFIGIYLKKWYRCEQGGIKAQVIF